MKEYALYKGEKLLSVGTINEISEETGLKQKTVHFYKSKAYKNRGTGKNRKQLILIDNED